MAYDFIISEDLDGVGYITLNRPDKLNALSYDLVRELDDALTKFEADDNTKAVVITGAGERAFSAGADIHEMADLSAEELAQRQARRHLLAYRQFLQADHRRDQWPRLWRRRVAVFEPRYPHRRRAFAIPLSGGELRPGEFELVAADAGGLAQGQGAALHRPRRLLPEL